MLVRLRTLLQKNCAELPFVKIMGRANCCELGVRHGDMSIEESLEMLRTEKVSDEMAKTLADGFGVLVEVLKALGTPEGEH
jgi:hypothetical protein